MKMKKLLSMGAIGLVLACSTSIGASAAARPDNAKIKSDMIAMFLEDKSPLTYNVKASTTVRNVINITTLKNDLEKNGFVGRDYTTLNTALGYIDSSKSIVANAKAIVVQLSKDGKIDDLLTEVKTLTNTLREFENTDATKKATIEKDIRDLIKGSNSTLDVIFGKNVDGKITMTIIQGNQIVLQLNSGNAYTISDSLGNNADKLTQYAEALKLFVQ